MDWTWRERSVLGLGLLLRLGLPLSAWLISRDPSIFYSRDTASYIGLAQAVLSGEGFSMGGIPELVRTPGYPLFLLPGMLAGAVEPLTITLQAIAGTITVGLVMAVTKGLSSSRGAVVLAGFAYAIEPLALLYTGKILSESLFALCLMLAALHLQRSLRSSSWVGLAGAALALSFAAYVRPIGYFLPAVTALTWLVVVVLRKSVTGGVVARIAVFLAISMSALGVWQVRNSLTAGYARFSAITEVTLYEYLAAAVRADDEGLPYYEVREQMLRAAEASRGPDLSEGEYYRRLGEIGGQMIAARPWVFLNAYVKGVIRVALDPGGVEYLKLFEQYPESGGLLGLIVDKGVLGAVLQLARERPEALLVTTLFGLILALYWVLAAAGARSVLRERPLRVEGVLMLVWPAYILLISGGPAALDRFRHPIMPLLAVLAGVGAAGTGPVRRRLHTIDGRERRPRRDGKGKAIALLGAEGQEGAQGAASPPGFLPPLAKPVMQGRRPSSSDEAAAMRIPIVARDHPGCRPVVEHRVKGLLVPPGDVTGLTDAVLGPLRDSEMRQKMGARGVGMAARRLATERIVARYKGLHIELGLESALA